MTRRWVVGTAIYATVAAGLAAVGDTRSPELLLAAVGLTLPAGIAGLLGVYFVYAIIVGLSRGLGAHVMSGNGWGPLWFVIVDEMAVFVLFAAVAVANAFIARDIARRISHQDESVIK
jgi:hypothetical protein